MALARPGARPPRGTPRRRVRRRGRLGGVPAHRARPTRPRRGVVAALAQRWPRHTGDPAADVHPDPPDQRRQRCGGGRLPAGRRSGVPVRLGRARPARPLPRGPPRRARRHTDPAASGGRRVAATGHLAGRRPVAQRAVAVPGRPDTGHPWSRRRHRCRRGAARLPPRPGDRRRRPADPGAGVRRPAPQHRPLAQPGRLAGHRPVPQPRCRAMLGAAFDLADAGPADAAVVPAAGEVAWRLTISAHRTP